MTEKNADQDEGLESPGTPKWYQDKDFWYGFVGWFVGNGIGWVLTSASPYSYANTLLILVLLLNIGALIFFAFKKPRIAFGMLTAFSLSLVVVIVLAIYIFVTCFRNPMF